MSVTRSIIRTEQFKHFWKHDFSHKEGISLKLSLRMSEAFLRLPLITPSGSKSVSMGACRDVLAG